MRIFSKEVVSGYFSQGLNVLYGVLLLPFLLTTLTSDEISYWMILLTLTSFSMVLDFGFSPTIMRAVSYAYNGSSSLMAEGFEKTNVKSEPNWNLIGNIVNASQRIYLIIALFSLLIIGGFGTIYIYYFLLDKNIESAYLTWCFFLVGYIFNIYYLYTLPVLMGVDKIYQANKINIIIRSSWIFFGILGVLVLKSTLAFAISQLIGALFGRLYGLFLLRSVIKVSLIKYDRNTLRALIPNSWRMGLVSFGAYLINKASIMIGGIFLTAQNLAGFTIAMQVLGVLSAFSQTYFNLNVPHFSALRISGDNYNLKKNYYKSVSVSLFLFISFSAFVVCFGNEFLEMIGSGTIMPKKETLLLIFIIGLLELNHTLAATFITTKNTIPFLKPALLSGVLILLMTSFLMSYFNNNILVLILVPGIIQLCYNNWKWPFLVYKELNKGK
ncbi:hypothetical protein H2Y54_15650 [Pectobacterium aroidearum]|uniref:O-unit flippase-like protein n=1 Tax=Pectobacterium aroidearum TaxID=1201031 RepID=UPI0015EFFAC8|nr:O-unit flippase-like protein [Pectobacterium aroidearum]MBA5237965.1 hypothetical protein [Pectobacterium aroidearum]